MTESQNPIHAFFLKHPVVAARDCSQVQNSISQFKRRLAFKVWICFNRFEKSSYLHNAVILLNTIPYYNRRVSYCCCSDVFVKDSCI